MSALIISEAQADVVWTHTKVLKVLPILKDGKRCVLSVEPETRRLSQNANYHGLIDQIAKHVGGDLAEKEDAKRILISAFRHDTKDDPNLRDDWARFGDYRVGRGLRGETVMLGHQSRDFTIKLAAAFVAWLEAFGAECGVAFRAPKSWEQWR